MATKSVSMTQQDWNLLIDEEIQKIKAMNLPSVKTNWYYNESLYEFIQCGIFLIVFCLILYTLSCGAGAGLDPDMWETVSP